MLGTIVNTSCIIAGSLLGSLARKAIKPEYRDALYNAMGLAALLLGTGAFVSNISKSEYPVLFIASLAIGSLTGTVLKISDRFNGLVSRYSKSRGSTDWFPDTRNRGWPKAFPPASCSTASAPCRWSVR